MSLVPDDLKDRLDVVAFDMDQTVLNIHTRGAVYGEKNGRRELSLEDLKKHVVPTFIEVVPQLMSKGLTVAIATNSDRRMACDGQIG